MILVLGIFYIRNKTITVVKMKYEMKRHFRQNVKRTMYLCFGTTHNTITEQQKMAEKCQHKDWQG